MKTMLKKPKVTSLGLARTSNQLFAKLNFDLKIVLEDKMMAENLNNIALSIQKFESIIANPQKVDPAVLAAELKKVDKALEKSAEKINGIQQTLEKMEKVVEERLTSRFEILKLTDPDDQKDTDNRKLVEEQMKSIKQLLETAKKKIADLQEPAEKAIQRLTAIKPRLHALGMSENLEKCQKKVKKLNEELLFLCQTAVEMSTKKEVVEIVSTLFNKDRITHFVPKLKMELSKSGKLLEEVDQHFSKILPNAEPKDEKKQEYKIVK